MRVCSLPEPTRYAEGLVHAGCRADATAFALAKYGRGAVVQSLVSAVQGINEELGHGGNRMPLWFATPARSHGPVHAFTGRLSESL
jgi:hypothetical protein